MRCVLGFICVLALGLMGCSETSGARLCEGPGSCDDGDACTEDLCPVAGEVCSYVPVTCNDYSDCTTDSCDSSVGCVQTAVADETPCAGGTCQEGVCQLTSSVLPCTDQGIRNALAAGGGPYTFECDGPTTIADVDAYIIEKDVSLDGEGVLTLEAPINVHAEAQDVQASLTGLNLMGIWGQPVPGNFITLSVTDSVVRGTGIAIDGALTLSDSTVSGSGSIEGALLTIVNSTISETGVGIVSNEQLVLINSTVSGNGDSDLGPEDASGIYVVGDATLINSTVSGNHDAPDIYVVGTLTMRNSIVDGVCSFAENASFTSNGYNIESPGDTCGFDQTGDQTGVSAEQLKLGPLADNGGPTETQALGAGSVAIDVIPETECLNAEGAPLTTDQRGFPRDSMCDVGPFEVQP